MGNLIECDDCGKKVSSRARACPGCGSPVPRRSRLVPALVWTTVGFSVLCVVGLFLDAAGVSKGTKGTGIAVGDAVRLESKGGSGVWLAADGETFDEMLDAQNSRSGELLRRLHEGGKVVYAPNGSVGVIVKSATFSRLVRVTDGPAIGFEGWVQGEYVRAR
jgi:hypothetical protein